MAENHIVDLTIDLRPVIVFFFVVVCFLFGARQQRRKLTSCKSQCLASYFNPTSQPKLAQISFASLHIFPRPWSFSLCFGFLFGSQSKGGKSQCPFCR